MHFWTTKAEYVKSLEVATSTLKTSLSQQDIVETKSDTRRNVAKNN